MAKKLTREDFIDKAKKIHGDKYDYSKVEYVNAHVNICIICPIHGEFWQRPDRHLEGCGCKKCFIVANAKKQTSTVEDFINKARKVHGDKYDYSKVEYVNNYTKVCIICPIHGEFWQIPSNHLKGQHCPKCAYETLPLKTIKPLGEVLCNIEKQCKKKNYEFLGFCNRKGEEVEYNGVGHIFLILKCNTCGNIWKTTVYENFINGKGCPQCAGNKRISPKEALRKIETVCEKYEIIFHNFTNNKGEEIPWINTNNTFLRLECKKCGNVWHSTSYSCFVNRNVGCPKCRQSHLEKEIMDFLNINNIKEFEYNNFYKWLDGLQLDFYFPQYNVAIECQGKQHFNLGGWRESFDVIKERDERKRRLCEKNGIKLLYYSNLHIDYPYHVFEDKEELLKEILKK